MPESITPETKQAASGWYPVGEETERYWDGNAWTEQSRPVAPVTGSPTTLANGSTPPWYRRTWVVATGALLVGVSLGVATAGEADPKDTVEYQALADDLSAVEDRLSQRDDELATVEAQLFATEDELTTVEGNLPERENAVAEAEAAVKKREAAVKAAERDVAQREKAVSKTEQQIDDSMLEPGTYLVPEEVSPGRYRTVNDVSYCYMSQDKGSNIVNNLAEEAGRPVFTVVPAEGTTFKIGPECGTVQKID